MSATNLSCPLLANMRKDFLKCKMELKHFKQSYRSECLKNDYLRREILKMKKSNGKLQCKIDEINRVSDVRKQENTEKVTRKRKQWDEIKNDCTKRRRFAHYKSMILSTLKEISICHRAEITIWVYDNKINFSLGPKDLSTYSNLSNEEALRHNNRENVYHDHRYACQNEDIFAENELFDDINHSQIYNSQGQWRIEHIRRLVHVLDNFRISHEAYHELRMVSKGHLPPLSKLAAQKKIMSDKIPYIKHPTVSLYIYDC